MIIVSSDYKMAKPQSDIINEIVIIDNVSFDKIMNNKSPLTITLPEKCHDGIIYIFINKIPLPIKLSVPSVNTNDDIDGQNHILLHFGETTQITYYNGSWMTISKYCKQKQNTNLPYTLYDIINKINLKKF